MFAEYIERALDGARYEKIEDKRPFYGEIPALKGVWATGKTLEDCRRHLIETLEGWILVRLRKGLSIPSLHGASLRPATRLSAHV